MLRPGKVETLAEATGKELLEQLRQHGVSFVIMEEFFKAEAGGADAETCPSLGADGAGPRGHRWGTGTEPDGSSSAVRAVDLAAEGAARRRNAEAKRYLAP